MLSLCAQRKQLGFPRRLTLFCTNALISCLDRALLWHKHRNIFLQKLEWHWVILCRMSAWSPVRSLQSLAKFFLISGAATATAWYAHPQLLDIAAHVLNLDFKDNVTAFQTSFFSFLSLVFAIYSGNTMAFLYDVSPPPRLSLHLRETCHCACHCNPDLMPCCMLKYRHCTAKVLLVMYVQKIAACL